jgi:hypothetical protein
MSRLDKTVLTMSHEREVRSMAKLGLSIPAMELRTECGRLSTAPWPVFLDYAAMDDLASDLLAAGVSVHLSHNGLLNTFLMKVLLVKFCMRDSTMYSMYEYVSTMSCHDLVKFCMS